MKPKECKPVEYEEDDDDGGIGWSDDDDDDEVDELLGELYCYWVYPSNK